MCTFLLYIFILLFYWLGRKGAQLQIIAHIYRKFMILHTFFNKCPSPHGSKFALKSFKPGTYDSSPTVTNV